ncbi:MAG: hypothetical protein K8R59_01920 [Thermoanaerobaculales bacterium]|nr:hypothetical protein [Thermoanaerobaculales bacterium]
MTVRNRWLPGLVAILLPSLLFLGVIATGYDGRPYLRSDCRYYMATAHFIWEDGDLDISNQLWQPWYAHNTDIALDQSGRFVPKHPLWMPMAALPFILLFGDAGALVFNFLQLAALCALMFVLARRGRAMALGYGHLPDGHPILPPPLRMEFFAGRVYRGPLSRGPGSASG